MPDRPARAESRSAARSASPRLGTRPAAAPRIRDAATLVIVDRAGPAARVLMGRRHPGQVFLPDTFVFPGGRVEAGDRAFARRHALPVDEAECLKRDVRGRPSDARAAALALAAVRETFEETGYVLGSPVPDGSAAADWTKFWATDHRPRLDTLAFFARAITPPGRPRRYDTRFFLTDATTVTHRPDRLDGELLDIGWFTLAEARRLNLPTITRHVIEDLAGLLAGAAEEVYARDVPFYRHRHGRMERTLLPRTGTPAR